MCNGSWWFKSEIAKPGGPVQEDLMHLPYLNEWEKTCSFNKKLMFETILMSLSEVIRESIKILSKYIAYCACCCKNLVGLCGEGLRNTWLA